MKKASEKHYINKINPVKNYGIFGIFCKTTKRPLRADGLSLLPSALRPRLVGVFGVLFFSIIGSLLMQNSYVYNVSAASLTITIPSSPLSLDLNPSASNGFSSTSGSFNVKTDNSSGYTVSIKSKNENGDNSLVNSAISDGSRNKLASISEAISEDTFKNGPQYLNMWGWLPSKLNSLDNTNYQIAPGKEEVILDSTEEANNETGINYTISLAAKVAETMPTGSYSNTFVITSIANQPKIAGIMQEWDYSDCNALGEEQVVTLQDNRDGNTYKVAKLKDGKCWMVENLKIAGKNISSSDSDVSSSFTIPSSNLTTFKTSSYTNVNNSAAYVDSTYGGYYTWNASTVTSVKMSSTSPVICGVITTCPNEIDNPSAKLAGERAKIVREELTTNETIAGTLSLITAPNSAEVIHYWTLKAEFA